MHDRKRIVGCVHVQPREVSPRATDCIKDPTLSILQKLSPRELVARNLGGGRQRILRHVLEPKAAERQGNPLAKVVAVDIHQLEAAAPEVACDALGRMKTGNNTKAGIVGLFTPAEHTDLGAEYLFGAMDEIGTVDRFARRRCGDHVKLAGARLFGKGPEAAKLLDSAGDALWIEFTGRDNTLAKARKHLFVEKHCGRPGDPLIDDKANRVRPDVDDGDRAAVLQPTLRLRNHQCAIAAGFLRRRN